MTEATRSSGGEPSDDAWRRAGDIAARILEQLAERDARRGMELTVPTEQLPSRWLSPPQVCSVWPGMTVTKLQRMRDEGRGPAYSKLGKTITYDLRDIEAFISGNRISTRDQQ